MPSRKISAAERIRALEAENREILADCREANAALEEAIETRDGVAKILADKLKKAEAERDALKARIEYAQRTHGIAYCGVHFALAPDPAAPPPAPEMPRCAQNPEHSGPFYWTSYKNGEEGVLCEKCFDECLPLGRIDTGVEIEPPAPETPLPAKCYYCGGVGPYCDCEPPAKPEDPDPEEKEEC